MEKLQLLTPSVCLNGKGQREMSDLADWPNCSISQLSLGVIPSCMGSYSCKVIQKRGSDGRGAKP